MSKITPYLLPLLLITSGILLLIFLLRRGKNQKQEPKQEPNQSEQEQETTGNNLTKAQKYVETFKLIREIFPDEYSDNFVMFATAQSGLETGDFTSKLYNEQNNLFGMRHPVIRQTKSLGNVKDYANFDSLEDSAEDLLLYYNHFKIAPSFASLSDYIKTIKGHGYFTAPYLDYYNGVRTKYNYLKTLIN
jgi:hypothetical protein